MRILLFVILLFVSTILVSFFYSKPVYHFHRCIYDRVFERDPVDEINRKAGELLKHNKKRKLHSYLNTLTGIYTDKPEIMVLAGSYYIRIDEHEKAIEIALEYSDKARLDRDYLLSAVKYMSEEGYYSEGLNLLEKQYVKGNAVLSFYRGLLLNRLGRYKNAVQWFRMADKEGYTNADYYPECSRAMVSSGNPEEAVGVLEHGYSKNPSDERIRKSLFDLYRRMGKYEKAAALSEK